MGKNLWRIIVTDKANFVGWLRRFCVSRMEREFIHVLVIDGYRGQQTSMWFCPAGMAAMYRGKDGRNHAVPRPKRYYRQFGVFAAPRNERGRAVI